MIKNLVLDCSLNPSDLNSNYQNVILKMLKELYENKSVHSGYIINVNKIKEYIHNSIVDGITKVKTLCECDVYKPVVDDIITCKVNMIHINGIFVNKYDIKILIPNTLNIFDIQDNKCIYKGKIININDDINVVIKQIRFENFNYTCIGNIV